jgi:hypothetical protein
MIRNLHGQYIGVKKFLVDPWWQKYQTHFLNNLTFQWLCALAIYLDLDKLSGHVLSFRRVFCWSFFIFRRMEEKRYSTKQQIKFSSKSKLICLNSPESFIRWLHFSIWHCWQLKLSLFRQQSPYQEGDFHFHLKFYCLCASMHVRWESGLKSGRLPPLLWRSPD